MKINILSLIVVSLLLSACKIQIEVPAGGSVQSTSGAYSCASGKICDIDVVDLFFDEEFVASPESGYLFSGWVKKDRGFCGGNLSSCLLYTSGFEGIEALLSFLESPDETFYLSPTFSQDRFTVEWLSGRTLYDVAFVGGGDEPDFPEALRFSFSNSGTVSYEGIFNSASSGETVFDVTDDGLLFFQGDSSAVYKICEISGDYLKTIRTENGEFDNVELFFFQQEAALKYASSLTSQVPGC
jgi:hypothetical protein